MKPNVSLQINFIGMAVRGPSTKKKTKVKGSLSFFSLFIKNVVCSLICLHTFEHTLEAYIANSMDPYQTALRTIYIQYIRY